MLNFKNHQDRFKYFNLNDLEKLKVFSIKPPEVNFFVRTLGIFSYFFTIIHLFRTFHFASGYGWLDPWVQVGYGQAFPSTAYAHHYYKESRIISISIESLFLKFSPFLINYFWEILAALTALLIYRISRLAENSILLSLFFGSSVALNPILWGDWAGGGDYYNTLGNLLTALTSMLAFNTSRLIANNQSSIRIKKMCYLLGILFTAILLETPSGIVILIPLTLLLPLSIKASSFRSKFELGKRIIELITWQFMGFISLIFFEVIYLIVLGESPIRLLAGPKFLLDSILDSSIQNAWSQDLKLSNFFDYPNLFLFTALLAIHLINFLYILIPGNKKEIEKRDFVFTLLPLIFFFFILYLQFSGRTILFTTSYFLTPVLILGLCLLSNFKVAHSNKYLITSFLIVLLLLKFVGAKEILLIVLLCLTLILLSRKLEFISSKCVKFRQDSSKFFIVVVLLASCLVNFELHKPINFVQCDDARVAVRAKVVEVAKTLDALGFKRGTLWMGADLDVLRESLVSDCSDFDGKPLGGILIAIAETGFLTPSSLGSIVIDSNVNRSDFAEDNLAFLNSREQKPNGCYLEWEIPVESSKLRFNFMSVDFGARLTCP